MCSDDGGSSGDAGGMNDGDTKVLLNSEDS